MKLMKNERPVNFFMPNFPVKSQKGKTQKKVRPPVEDGVKVTRKFCEKFNLFNKSYSNPRSKNLSYKNQNNYCEIRSLIMTPIRLTKLEISLPEFSALPSPKSRPRKIATASTRRRSIESKSFLMSSVEIPAEIITTKYSSRLCSAKPFGIRKSEQKIRNSSRHPLARQRTGDEKYSRQRYMSNDRVRDTESASPTNYSPVYTNTFDV